MKFLQSIMNWYMNLLTLSYPLHYAKRLLSCLPSYSIMLHLSAWFWKRFFCTVAALNLWSKNLKYICEEVPFEWNYSSTCFNFNKQRTVSQLFFKVFDHNCKMVYYNGTVTLFWDLKYCLGGYNATVTLFWDFKIACEEWQRYINSGIAKRGNKI